MTHEKLKGLTPKIKAYVLLASAADDLKIPPYYYDNKADRDAIAKELKLLSNRLIKSANTIHRNAQIKTIFEGKK